MISTLYVIVISNKQGLDIKRINGTNITPLKYLLGFSHLNMHCVALTG